MTKLTVIGGSGYAGSHIVEAAAVRGLDVTSVTRNETAEQTANVTYQTGSITAASDRARILDGAETVVVAISPRGDMTGEVRGAVASFADDAAAAGVRLGVIIGAGSLYAYEGGPLVIDTPEFPDAVKPEAREMGAVLDDLRARTDDLDWFAVSPAGGFGGFAPGEFRGEYRVGGDVLVSDSEGESFISGADFGVAVVNEVETPKHHRARFNVAY